MLRRIHRWLGVALAGWLVLVSLSGILLLWEDEYYGWRYPSLPDRPYVPVPKPAVIEQILSSANGRVGSLLLPTSSLPAYRAYLIDGREALFHPDTAAPVAEWGSLDALPAFLFELHVYLLLGDTGMNIVGALGVLVFLNIVFGSVLWFRRRRVFRLRYFLPANLSRARLIRGHAAQGAFLAILFLLVAFTGIAMAFSAPVYAGLNKVFGAAEILRPTVRQIEPGSARVDWRSALDSVSSAFPAATPRLLGIPKTANEPLTVRLRNSGELHPNGRSYLVLKPGDGEVLERIDATRTGLGPAIGNSMYPLHAGKTDWPGYRAVLSVLSLSLTFIGISGAWLALTRPRSDVIREPVGRTSEA